MVKLILHMHLHPLFIPCFKKWHLGGHGFVHLSYSSFLSHGYSVVGGVVPGSTGFDTLVGWTVDPSNGLSVLLVVGVFVVAGPLHSKQPPRQ